METTQQELRSLDGWVSLAEAASRIPSPRPGKSTRAHTVLRIALKNNLAIIRRGPWRFVKWSEILALFETVRGQPRIARSKPIKAQSSIPKWVTDDLKRRGLLK